MTPRETEVVGYIADGLTRQETAVRMGVADRTVRTHVQNIYAKTGATNRVELTRWMMAQELAELRSALMRVVVYIDRMGGHQP